MTAHAGDTVLLDEMTWTEVRDAIKSGSSTVIIPVGGTEQNGPHMALGKHNFRAAALSQGIASTLGHTVVAPVMSYVPEGRISPPGGHMRFPGTISVSQDAFENVLLGAGRSMKQAGFRDVVFIGDSGNYQDSLKSVAAKLNKEWAASPTRAHHIVEYYRAATNGFAQILKSKGVTDAQIGVHAALADTSLMMGVDPARVRAELLKASPTPESATGIVGEPAQSSAALGKLGTDLIVERAVAAIRQAVAAPR
ncbi:MAG: creatininase family protein [Ramlibacter sp.]|nr:creatininase family protein [Ramlibacter sp.]